MDRTFDEILDDYLAISDTETDSLREYKRLILMKLGETKGLYGMDEVRECIKGIKEIPNRYTNTIFRFLCDEDAHIEFDPVIVDRLRVCMKDFVKKALICMVKLLIPITFFTIY